jgi:NADPH:quinone reductase-like Zn-dependent oxidoreductase
VAQIFPSTFPSGQGSDLAGVIQEAGAGAGGFSPGDEVIGFTDNRASQAELVPVEAGRRGRADRHHRRLRGRREARGED